MRQHNAEEWLGYFLFATRKLPKVLFFKQQIVGVLSSSISPRVLCFIDLANNHSKQMGAHLLTMPSVPEDDPNPMQNTSCSGKKTSSQKKRQNKQNINKSKRNTNGGKSLNFEGNQQPLTPEILKKEKANLFNLKIKIIIQGESKVRKAPRPPRKT